MLSATRLAYFHTTSRFLSATGSPLFKLRQRTGLAYNLCREALDKHSNDIEQAEIWLKAQAIARGLQKATKMGGRSAREGLISITIPKDNSAATIFELNCETDFVARNQTFKDLVLDISEQISTSSNISFPTILKDQKLIGTFQISEERLKEIEQQIAPLVVKLGENIKIRRSYHVKVMDGDDVKIFGQIHSQSAQKVTEKSEIIAGRFGAVVAMRHVPSHDHATLKSYGNRLCQHVIGYNPSYIELPENIRRHLEEAEKEQKEKNTKMDEADNDEVEYSDQEETTNHNSRDDWPSMMDQTLIMSDNISVREFCKAKGIEVIHFDRFECGVQTDQDYR